LKLYELSNAYLSILDQLDSEELGLDCLEDTLQSINDAIEVKTENMTKLIKMLEYDADAIKAEEERLKKRRIARENRVRRIKDYMLQQMMTMGKEKITTPFVTAWLQESKSVDDYNPSIIPAEYQKVSYNIDKVRLMEDLKKGKEVPGACIKVTKGVRLR